MADIDMLRLLLRHNRDFASTYAPNGTLRLAAVIDHPSLSPQETLAIVDFFVKEAGVDINAANLDGQAAIHLAAKTGNTNVMAAFISQGANLSSTDHTGMSAFEIACSMNHEAVMTLIGRERMGAERQSYQNC
jgi:ankyrin repeat protein